MQEKNYFFMCNNMQSAADQIFVLRRDHYSQFTYKFAKLKNTGKKHQNLWLD